jgi:ankyrin repeat protein
MDKSKRNKIIRLIEDNDLFALKLEIEEDTDLNCVIEEGLMDAISANNQDLIDFLLKKYKGNRSLTRALQTSVVAKNFETSLYILKNYNVVLNDKNHSVLELIVYNGDITLMEYILKNNLISIQSSYMVINACSVTGNEKMLDLVFSYFTYENEAILNRCIVGLFLNEQYQLFNIINKKYNIRPLITEEWIKTKFNSEKQRNIIKNYIKISDF